MIPASLFTSLLPGAVTALALIGLPVAGYWIGHIDGVSATQRTAQAAQAASLTRLIAEQAQLAAQDREILFADVARKTRIVTQFQVIDREVTRYALAHPADPACLRDDGLRLWHAAARNDAAAIAAATPAIDDRFPGHLADPRLGDRAGLAGQLHHSGAAVPHAAGALHQPGRVGVEYAAATHAAATRAAAPLNQGTE